MQRRFPRGGWVGASVMGLGFGLDLVAHTLLAGSPALGAFSLPQHGAHLVVLVGMVVLLGAVVIDGTRHGAARARQEGSPRDALR